MLSRAVTSRASRIAGLPAVSPNLNAVATTPVVAPSVPVRWLDLHEHQSKNLMSQNGIFVQKFETARSADEAYEKCFVLKERADSDPIEYVVKALVKAGGRGKGTFDTGFKGGVHVVDKEEEVKRIAGEMLGHRLITKQTVKEGVPVNEIMIAEGLDIDEEKYLAILMDREHNGPVMVASPDGGMDIEEVAEKTPDRIFYEAIDINKGIQKEQTDRLAAALGFTGAMAESAAEQMSKLYDLFLKVDASQIEINPFASTTDGQVVCFDAKLNFDDNAEFRQKEIFALHDPAEDDPREVEAAKVGLAYIGMDGNIGCLVNGAGLAMATMDIIQLYGGSPANFLDVGGGATEEQVEGAFRILTADKQVEAILVNIFGGIMKCDVIAQGVVNAAKNVGLNVPLVVRLAGTNVEKGQQILEQSGLPIIAADDLDDAAKHAVAALNA